MYLADAPKLPQSSCLVALLCLLASMCVSVQCLFLAVRWVGLQCVIVAIPGYTHFIDFLMRIRFPRQHTNLLFMCLLVEFSCPVIYATVFFVSSIDINITVHERKCQRTIFNFSLFIFNILSPDYWNFLQRVISYHNSVYMRGSRGRDRGSGTPLKDYKNIGFLSLAGPDPLKNHKAIKPAFNVGPSSACQQNVISLVGR